MKKETLPVLITVDIEPFDRQAPRDNPKDWYGVEEIVASLNQFRSRVSELTQKPVRFSWFWRMDHQIKEVYGTSKWAAQRFDKLASELLANDDEFGLHPHTWFWDEDKNLWFENFLDPAWASYCLELSFAAYRESFGPNCKSVRFGSRWISPFAISELERLGARYDLTVEPDSDWEVTEPHLGEAANFDSAPIFPYRPAPDDFRKADSSGQRDFWMIPMTTVSAELPLEFKPDTKPKKRGKFARLANKLASRVVPSLADFYEGNLDWATTATIYGWVYDPNNQDRICEVDIYDGDQLLTRLVANGFRPDLAEIGIGGDGCRSFWMHAPSQLRDGSEHAIHAKIANGDFELGQSPKMVSRAAGEKAQRGTIVPYLESHPSFFRQLIDSVLRDEKREHLALVVRTDVGARKEPFAHFRQNLDYLASHLELGRLEFVTPSEMERYFPEMVL